MIGANMDTDVIMGIESGPETILVLSGVTSHADIERYSYRPARALGSSADTEP